MQLLCRYKASSGQELFTLHCVDTLFPYLGCINKKSVSSSSLFINGGSSGAGLELKWIQAEEGRRQE